MIFHKLNLGNRKDGAIMQYINDIRELVGHTPLLKLNNISPSEDIHIFGKLEYFNPGGSVKDRVGLKIIETAEKQGLLKPGYTIIEATAGNTGIGLALAAFEKGYHLKLVVPAKFAVEKQILMQALGAQLIVTPTEEGIEGAVKKAKELSEQIPNSFMAKQFDNPANLAAHKQTGKEIYEALDGQIDVLVAGAGSGGTLIGIASYLKAQNPNIKIVLADPIGSILGGGEEGTYHIEGIGNHFIPSIFDRHYIDEVEKISDEEAFYYVQLLGKKEGVLVGSSSGAALAAAMKQAYKLHAKHPTPSSKPFNIVTIFPDRSDRYFSQNLYNFDMNLSDFRFNDLFDNWAIHYDESVFAKKGEYYEVFENYEGILEATVDAINLPSGATVLDIGSGTGNLSITAAKKGYEVTAIEPNLKMRQIASSKYPLIPVQNGSFLTLPIPDHSIDAIISSYAFHHLSDDEKAKSVKFLVTKLTSRGKIIITDTMYETPKVGEQLLKESLDKGATALANDLKTEFYTTHDVLKQILEDVGFKVSFKKQNKFVWILIAERYSETN